MPSIQRVAVLGGSGNVGQAVIAALLRAGFIITVVGRPGSQAPDFPDATFKTADYSNLPCMTDALSGMDAVVETFNPNAAVYQSNIVRAAIASRVSHLITPDFGPDTFHPNANGILNYELKLRAQRELEALVAHSNGALAWTAIVTGGCRLDTCGEAVVAVLEQPEKYRNRPAYFANYTATTNELVEIIKQVADDPWGIVDVSVEDAMRKGRQLWDEDTRNGAEVRIGTLAYNMLGSASLFDENNYYGADFDDKVESGWHISHGELGADLRSLLQ
ncbi:hypothetical protein BKA60DRAFT_687523 [Fusarium oxysporum]|nr:hypothetical protein BKA60DRAFT_687523 [Fusarium oxysporum]